MEKLKAIYIKGDLSREQMGEISEVEGRPVVLLRDSELVYPIQVDEIIRYLDMVVPEERECEGPSYESCRQDTLNKIEEIKKELNGAKQ